MTELPARILLALQPYTGLGTRLDVIRGVIGARVSSDAFGRAIHVLVMAGLIWRYRENGVQFVGLGGPRPILRGQSTAKEASRPRKRRPVTIAVVNGELQRQCTHCGQHKPLKFFTPDERNAGGVRGCCRECANHKQRIARAEARRTEAA